MHTISLSTRLYNGKIKSCENLIVRTPNTTATTTTTTTTTTTATTALTINAEQFLYNL